MKRLPATLLPALLLCNPMARLHAQSAGNALRSGDVVRAWTSDTTGGGPQFQGTVNASADGKVELTDRSGTRWTIPASSLKRLEVRGASVRSLHNAPTYALGGALTGILAHFLWQVAETDKTYRHGYSSAPTRRYMVAAGTGAALGALYGAIRPHPKWIPVVAE